MIAPEKIEEIKNASDITDILGGYISLRKTGSNFKALCPFHQEKTPSFIVSPDKQIFHCFGCGQGGNVFTFVQRIENISFVEAVKMLAKRSGIEVEAARTDYNYTEKEKLLAANKEAAVYFREMFLKSERAVKYAEGRGIDAGTLEDFKIGFAPGEGGLGNYLKSKNISEDAIVKSWLCNQGSGGLYDIFRERVMFPIQSIYGDVIGFGGRVLDDSLPKYINSKETAVYIKGRVLYNLNNARRHAGDGSIVIVEGYMDTITVYAAGIKNIVATLGTAMTIDQAKLLKRYAEKAVIMYDMDDPGRAGAVRAGENLFAEGIETSVVTFEGVKDPDDFIKKFGAEALRQKIKTAQPFLEYKIDQLKKQGDINSSYFKETVIKEMAGMIEKTDSTLIRNDAVRKTADILGVQPHLVDGYFRKKEASGEEAGLISPQDDTIALKAKGPDSAEYEIISAALNSLGTDDESVILRHIAERRDLLGLTYEDFKNTAYAAIMAKVKGYFKAGEKNILQKIELDYIDNEDLNNIIAGILSEKAMKDRLNKDGTKPKKQSTESLMQDINECLVTIKKRKVSPELETLSQKIASAEASGDTVKLNEYLKEKTRLQILKQKRGGEFEQES